MSEPVVGVGEVLGETEACAVAWEAAAAAVLAAGAAPASLGPLSVTVTTWFEGALGVEWLRPTTISGALAKVATLVPPAIEPTTTPKASVAITATAVARGPGISNPSRCGRSATSPSESASGAPGGSEAAGPRSCMAPISRETWIGSGPRRAPHSRQ